MGQQISRYLPSSFPTLPHDLSDKVQANWQGRRVILLSSAALTGLGLGLAIFSCTSIPAALIISTLGLSSLAIALLKEPSRISKMDRALSKKLSCEKIPHFEGNHKKAFSEIDNEYKEHGAHRSYVNGNIVSWDTPHASYEPHEYTEDRANGWANYDESMDGTIKQDESNNRPLNPKGRTGLTGRGGLGKWGPNRIEHLILTRVNPKTYNLECAFITRAQGGQVALPGGMLKLEETGIKAVKRTDKQEINISIHLNTDSIIFKGYVDDNRNTDNAWVETTACHYHMTQREAVSRRLEAGVGAEAVAWYPITEKRMRNLFASHSILMKHYLKRLSKEALGMCTNSQELLIL